MLLRDDQFLVRTVALDHHDIKSLAFRFEENTHINVWKNRLESRGLPTGPWLTDLKKQARSNVPDETPIQVRWRTRDGSREETFSLGELKRDVLEFVPGQKVCYVTDVGWTDANRERLIEFATDADVLFIEAVFLEADAALAAGKSHLTTTQAGTVARLASVSEAHPFHFSARYHDDEDTQRAEFMRAWRGVTASSQTA